MAEEFVDCAVPPKEREYQDGLPRPSLISDLCVNMALNLAAVNSLKRRDAYIQKEIAEFEAAREAQQKKEAWMASELERYKKRAYVAEDKFRELEESHAAQQKRWENACAKTNKEMMALKEKVQVLETENFRLSVAAESHSKQLEERDSKVADARSQLQQKDQDLMMATQLISALESEKATWFKMKDAYEAENASLVESEAAAQTEARNAKALFEEANDAHIRARETLKWVMSEGIKGVSFLTCSFILEFLLNSF